VVIICQLLQLYTFVLFARAVSTWFPVRPGGPGAQVVGVLVTVTEPVLAPARRVIPPIGMIDISFLVVIIGVQVLRGIICR
jgi:YggT family protein